jgi:hypothetical protein
LQETILQLCEHQCGVYVVVADGSNRMHVFGRESGRDTSSAPRGYYVLI